MEHINDLYLQFLIDLNVDNQDKLLRLKSNFNNNELFSAIGNIASKDDLIVFNDIIRLKCFRSEFDFDNLGLSYSLYLSCDISYRYIFLVDYGLYFPIDKHNIALGIKEISYKQIIVFDND